MPPSRATPSVPRVRVWLPWVTVTPLFTTPSPFTRVTEYSAVLAKPEAPLVPAVFTCVAELLLRPSASAFKLPLMVSVPILLITCVRAQLFAVMLLLPVRLADSVPPVALMLAPLMLPVRVPLCRAIVPPVVAVCTLPSTVNVPPVWVTVAAEAPATPRMALTDTVSVPVSR